MKKKILTTLALVVCAVALVIGSVAGTLAYLRVSVYVTNTFTYGKVAITLDESAVDEYGHKTQTGTRVIGNRYKLFPGTTYDKDPVIHVDPSTEDMFLFLKVDNGIAGLALTPEDASRLECKTIHQQLLDNGWKVYTNEAGDTYRKFTETTVGTFTLQSSSTVYYYSVGKAEDQTDFKIVTKAMGDIATFTTFTITDNQLVANEETLTAYVQHQATVTVTAYAIQTVGEGISGDLHQAAAKFAAEFESARIPAATPPATP